MAVISDATATGNIATNGDAVTLNTTRMSAGAIQITGTWTGTVQFEGSADGTNFAALSNTPAAGGSAVTSATAVGLWQFNTVGLVKVRVRASAAITGTAAVTITAQARAFLGALFPAGAIPVANANNVLAASSFLTADETNKLLNLAGPNGSGWKYGYTTESVTLATAASTDSTTNLLPAGSEIEAVVARVTTVIPTAATFLVGDASNANRFKSGVAVAANTTAIGLDHLNTPLVKQDSAAKVRITPNLTPGTATGVVELVVFYKQFVAPTS